MKLGVIGDIHLFSLRVHPRRLLSKRALGHVNLAVNRRKRFEHALLPVMLERLRSLNSDLVLMSGDVSTSSLESEFAALRGALDGHGEDGTLAALGAEAVLVPGNHDRYTFKARRVRRIEQELAALMPEEFPHVRRLNGGGAASGSWTLIALDAAVPNRVLSRGKLGREQFAAALQVIEEAKAGDGLVVLCHYPCVVPAGVPSGWTHDLAEAKRLRWALQGCAARVLFVHGHVHRPWYVAGPKGLRRGFELLNAGSPCLKSTKYPRGQGFWEVDLPERVDGEVVATHHVPVRGDAAVGLDWEARRWVNGERA